MPTPRNALSSRKTSSAEVKDSRGTVWGLTVECTAVAGSVIIRDGGASGTIVYQTNTPGDPGVRIPIPLVAGITCATSIYVTLSNAYATVVYT